MRSLICLIILTTLMACSSEADTDAETNMMDSSMDMKSEMSEKDNTEDSMTEYQCNNTDHPKVGQIVILSTLHHDVAGQVTIKDNCTIEVNSFTYDGQGPSVFFYGGIDGDYQSGFAFGPQLNGTVFDNDTFTITLDSPEILDQMNGVSVWCYDFAVSFGDGRFM